MKVADATVLVCCTKKIVLPYGTDMMNENEIDLNSTSTAIASNSLSSKRTYSLLIIIIVHGGAWDLSTFLEC